MALLTAHLNHIERGDRCTYCSPMEMEFSKANEEWKLNKPFK